MRAILKNKMLIVLLLASIGGVLLSQSAAFAVDTGSVSRVDTENFFGIRDNAHYEIAFRQASLREVMQFLAWVAEINIVIPEGIEGVVNVSFRDITVSGALNAIIRSNELEYTVEGRVVRIGKADQFKESGEDLKTETFRLRFAPADEMLPKLQQLLTTRGSAVSDSRTNSLIIRELLSNIDNIRRFVDDIDIKDAQVLIESKILEATRSFSRGIGIQWGVNRGVDGWDVRTGGVSAVGQADSGRNLNVNLVPSGTPTSGVLIGGLIKSTNLDFQILAAEEKGDVYVISDPSVVTSNGQPANIRSGATIYVQGTGSVNIGTTGGSTTSAGGGSLEEIETGVELKVTPQITIDDYVKLNIEAITSTPDFSRAVQGIPVVVDNTATTTVLVKNGETTVIGGLTRYSDSIQKKGVPGLSRIPVLGNLFRSKEKQLENTELMVFIKPTIIRVQGVTPAQIRIHEIEQLQESMYIEPMINPQKDIDKRKKKAENVKDRTGNKYVR